MLENELAQYTHEITFEKLDPGTIHLLKRNILDSYAGICASLQDKGMLGKFDRMASMIPNEKGISIWGINRKANESETVFMNSILGRRSDFVNTYLSPNKFGGSHPSDNVSLVLTIADWLEKSGEDTLTFTYLAYYLSCAFANFYYPEQSHYDHDVQALFYTPLVIGLMMGLTVDQLTEAQRIAGSLGLDINQSAMGEVSDWRACTYASCAMRALQTVRMALAGFEGPKKIYEGKAGVNRFMQHSQSFWDPAPDLGAIIFKQWPAMVFCSTPIDVALEIAHKIDDYQSIDKIQVLIYKKAKEVAGLESSYHPTGRAGRTHSIPYCVAAALVKKTIEYSYFDDDFIGKERGVADLIPKVMVDEDKKMTETYPDGAPCKIIVTLKDGSILDGYLDYPHGDPHDPLSDQEIESKAYEYLSLIVDKEEASSIIQRVWDLGHEPSIKWLVDPLKKRVLT